MITSINHLCCLLNVSLQDLTGIVQNIDSFYYEKRQPKMKYGKMQCENGAIRYRNLCISRYPLKRIQGRINDLLQQIELPSHAYGSVKGKSNLLNAEQHMNSRYFFNVDLANFFPNISHKQVFRMFVQNKLSPAVSRLLTQLTTYKGGLPQGPPSSPRISNLVFAETGRKLMKASEGHGITFTSYLDDLTFSSKVNFKHLTPALLEIIRQDGFHPSHKKISYKSFRAEVTGVMVYANRLWPIKAMVDAAEGNPFRTAYIESIRRFSIKRPRRFAQAVPFVDDTLSF